jgi:hypothetical protein
LSGPSLDLIAPIRPLQLCADGGYQLRLGVLGVPLIMVPDRKNRRIARDQLTYSQIIGSLMYLASATRPDISYAMSKLSRFVSKPGDDHWRALERVLRYLKGTMTYNIHYTGNPKVLEGYCDANWISDADELYATSEYVFLFGGGAVS